MFQMFLHRGFLWHAGQAVVQIIEDTRTKERHAIKFFLSSGTSMFRPHCLDVLCGVFTLPIPTKFEQAVLNCIDNHFPSL